MPFYTYIENTSCFLTFEIRHKYREIIVKIGLCFKAHKYQELSPLKKKINKLLEVKLPILIA